MRKTPKKSKTKKYLRKIFFGLLTLAVIGTSLYYGWEYTKPDNFPIKNAKIFATYEHVDKKPLQKVISKYLSNGFFYLNVNGMKQELLNFPWIYAVSVKRQLPDTITINVAEQHALLQWGEDALINPDGKRFSPKISTFPKNLPIIFGPEKQASEIFTTYQKMLRALEPLDLTIKKLNLNPRHFWELVLSNDAKVYLKEVNPVTQLELMANLYRKITANHSNSPKSIDLRYQSGLAVKWN